MIPSALRAVNPVTELPTTGELLDSVLEELAVAGELEVLLADVPGALLPEVVLDCVVDPVALSATA